MSKNNQKTFNDYIEVIIFVILLLTLLVIFIPNKIWKEEDYYTNESRYRMQTIYNVENFYNILVGNYEEDGSKAISLVNAVRDSLTSDSLFLGDQSISVNGEEFLVNVPRGFDVEYDTTFGLRRVLKETIIDTTVTILMKSEESGLNDNTLGTDLPITAYITSAEFDIGDGHNFGFVWRMLPDVTFDGSNSVAPQITLTVRPRQNSGTQYGSADTPAVTSGNNYALTRTYNVQQFTGQIGRAHV